MIHSYEKVPLTDIVSTMWSTKAVCVRMNSPGFPFGLRMGSSLRPLVYFLSTRGLFFNMMSECNYESNNSD